MSGSVVQIRKQGGAAIITLPPTVLKGLNSGVGDKLELDVIDGVLTAKIANLRLRKRYTLAELLEGVTPEFASEIRSSAQEWMDTPAIGQEQL